MAQYGYLISRNTKAILAHDSPYYKARIFEREEPENVIKSPQVILEENCIIYGSSLHGRRESVKKLLGLKYKVPIPVDPKKDVFFFPTAASRNKDCVWLAYYQIQNFREEGDRLKVQFLDGTCLLINVSLHAFSQQYLKTAQVITMMSRPSFYDHTQPFTSVKLDLLSFFRKKY
ncbi:competence protein ComK [Lentibacillus saliphilus]|uniref:competence protein ComK n=1 Tax=Lentibacillus saliphilus TaxID=2737028 RepID=UPI001C3054FC|nr:competence protein ComK [Lentibacillus saliphilus]